ncbi:MAG: tetratricopeptide repeat protein [Roseobacter sp.]
MLKNLAFIFAVCVPQAAFAQTCPMMTDTADKNDSVFAELLKAPNEADGRAIGRQLWAIWVTAPDDDAQILLDQGRKHIRTADYEKAVEYFSALITYCPTYAEGWNQRAYAYFLSQKYDAALDDIAKALDIEPRHFGALSGRAIVLISMGRPEIGYTALREALAIHPWLSERHLLPQGDKI